MDLHCDRRVHMFIYVGGLDQVSACCWVGGRSLLLLPDQTECFDSSVKEVSSNASVELGAGMKTVPEEVLISILAGAGTGLVAENSHLHRSGTTARLGRFLEPWSNAQSNNAISFWNRSSYHIGYHGEAQGNAGELESRPPAA